MQYLECTRFLTQDYELDNTVIGTMMDELRALDGVSWFGTYQYNGLNFEEFQQESYLSYARAHGSRERAMNFCRQVMRARCGFTETRGIFAKFA